MTLKDHLYSLEEPLADPNPNATMQDDLDDESEETVSLSGLPVYSYDTNHSDTVSDQDSMINESFEFFSEEWVKKVKESHINESIVFCGNLILPKQSISSNTQEFEKHDHGSMEVDRNSGSSKSIEFARFKKTNKGINHGNYRENATKRVLPELASKKSRWYFYGVGLAGIPAEMDLSAIKRRQNRRQLNPPVRIQGGCETEESGGFHHAKGLGRLIRDLSCNNQTDQANSMVKNSLVYIPRVG